MDDIKTALIFVAVLMGWVAWKASKEPRMR
jgi:hypothetical protein